jgi:hypothetical protein
MGSAMARTRLAVLLAVTLRVDEAFTVRIGYRACGVPLAVEPRT